MTYMKLFVNCHGCGNKIYIESTARLRSELPSLFKVRCERESCSNNNLDDYYTADEVFAESSESNTVSSMIVGATLGFLVGGIVGGVLGSSVLGLLGSQAQNPARDAVKKFNSSLVTYYLESPKGDQPDQDTVKQLKESSEITQIQEPNNEDKIKQPDQDTVKQLKESSTVTQIQEPNSEDQNKKSGAKKDTKRVNKS